MTKLKIFNLNNLALEKEEFFEDDWQYPEEHHVEKYFKSKGYEIIKCSAHRGTIPDISMLSHLLFSEQARNRVKESFISGMPDFLVWNRTDFMFVEVKCYNSGLKINQLEWFLNFKDLPAKLYVVQHSKLS